MSLVSCQECGKQISDLAPSCPNCGFTKNSKPKASSTQSRKGIYFIAFVVIFAAISVLTGHKSPTQSTTPLQHSLNGVCDKHPLEIFPVGVAIENGGITNLADTHCPGATFRPDQTIVVSFNGRLYYMKAVKDASTIPPKYTIESIRGV